MRKLALSVCLAALALVSACSDRSTSPTGDLGLTARRSDPIVPVCLAPTQIETLIRNAFVDGSPDENSALGKWDNIQKQFAAYTADGSAAKLALTQEKVLDLVQFLLGKYRERKLLFGASESALSDFARLINAMFCYALMEGYYYPGGDAALIFPTDLAQTLERTDGQAAMRFQANTVDVPTLVAITSTSDTLKTNLDKYPVNFSFSKYPSDRPFTKPIVTEVCADTPDRATYEALVLGHNKSDGTFELLPEAPALLTRCTGALASAKESLGDKLLALVLPRKLYASMTLAGGGVAGSLAELSPIGPVDPRVNVVKVAGASEAPIGSIVSPAPRVRLETPNFKTRMSNVVVAVSQATGPGYQPSLSVVPSGARTDAAGELSVSWRIGNTPNATYGIRVAPLTDDVSGAVTGTLFSPNPATFDVVATAPARVVVTNAPATGSSFTAGVVHTPATRVEVRDNAGRLVEGYTGAVSMRATAGMTMQALSGTATINAQGGVALFNNLAIERTGTFTMTPAADYGAGALAPGGAYDVVITAAAANTITALTTVPATSSVGTVYPVQVEVRDRFGNLAAGVPVFFTPAPDANNVTPRQATTQGNGRASASWTVQFGTNTLFAALDQTAQEGRFVEFRTDVATSSAVSLTCTERGNRAAIDSSAVILTRPPQNGNTVRPIAGVQFYFSINGTAKAPTPYPIEVTAFYTSSAGVPTTAVSTATVPLRGSASEDLAGLFRFTAFTPRANTPVVFRFKGPSIANQIRFNVGPCNPNDRNCRARCDAKIIANDKTNGFDLFANPIVRDGSKIDLFSALPAL